MTAALPALLLGTYLGLLAGLVQHSRSDLPVDRVGPIGRARLRHRRRREWRTRRAEYVRTGAVRPTTAAPEVTW